MRPALTLLLLVLPGLLSLLSGCARQDSLDVIRDRGELVVVSRNGPTTYYLGAAGPTGFEYALASLLARELGVTLRVEPAYHLDDIFSRLQRGEADFAAAGLTLTDERASLYPHSIPYNQLVTQVVYVAGTRRPRDLQDLADMSIVTLAGSSHSEMLRSLRESTLPGLSWQEIAGADTTRLLQRVDRGEAQLALIDSGEFVVQQSLHPRLKVAFDLSAQQHMVWYLPPGRDHTRLLVRINTLLDRLSRDGSLKQLREKHFGHTAGVSRISSHTFTRMMREALPPYRELIQRVAQEYQLSWHLLAAIAYQESHWNPMAASPTGVRGMMMLTLPTARELGVDNRLDAAQSLRGGARYLKDILRRLPPDIAEPDRTWMALAAYNIGMGHLEDARVLTERQGGDPHLWPAVMQRLPLLRQEQYYRGLRHGYARGDEAARYVQNIRLYYSILQWQDIPDNHSLPPLSPGDYLPEILQDMQIRAL